MEESFLIETYTDDDIWLAELFADYHSIIF